MTFEEAKAMLNACTRHELRDHAFGDCEYSWTNAAGEDVASGYIGSAGSEVGIGDTCFVDREADELSKCGILGEVERNDSTGPDEFRPGECMRGLTQEGVLDELTNK